ncbi:MAG TPA: hypothetical protein VES94_04745 [Burkholderiales bacterium]|nr:hypothetical protein [Burkholderiales bacterium]
MGQTLRWLVGVLVVAGLLFGAYTWIVLSWSYSEGERAGYVQKLSKKGWICKTWEGELALVTMPGTVGEKFYFSVRDDAVAQKINQSLGKRVTLTYQEHIGVPTTCFAETRHFVRDVRNIEDPTPLSPPPPPAATQPSADPPPRQQ